LQTKQKAGFRSSEQVSQTQQNGRYVAVHWQPWFRLSFHWMSSCNRRSLCSICQPRKSSSHSDNVTPAVDIMSHPPSTVHNNATSYTTLSVYLPITPNGVTSVNLASVAL